LIIARRPRRMRRRAGGRGPGWVQTCRFMPLRKRGQLGRGGFADLEGEVGPLGRPPGAGCGGHPLHGPGANLMPPPSPYSPPAGFSRNDCTCAWRRHGAAGLAGRPGALATRKFQGPKAVWRPLPWCSYDEVHRLSARSWNSSYETFCEVHGAPIRPGEEFARFVAAGASPWPDSASSGALTDHLEQGDCGAGPNPISTREPRRG